MDSANASSTPKPSHDDDAKWALLLEYDAADFRARHELLDRERITVRDIARWRRETAKLRASKGNVARAKATPRATKKAADNEAAEASADGDAAATAAKQSATRSRSRRGTTASAAPAPAAHLSALRSDVVAAHASALIYHADALSRLVANAPPAEAGYRRRSTPLDRLTAAAQDTSAAAREVLSARRRSGRKDTTAKDAVDVSAELTEMLSKLTDYPSLAVAVELLARELEPSEAGAAGLPAKNRAARNRRHWWGADDDSARPGSTESVGTAQSNPGQSNPGQSNPGQSNPARANTARVNTWARRLAENGAPPPQGGEVAVVETETGPAS